MKKTVLLSLFFITACATQQKVITQTMYQDVYRPVPCNTEMPAHPQLSGKNAAAGVLELIEYAKKLEIAIRTCRGEK